MTSHRCQHNFTFGTIKNGYRAYSPLPFVLFSPKEKCCWCTQNYLWDV